MNTDADLAQLTPDDLVAILANRHQDVQLEAYVSLARSRRCSVLDVLRAAVDDNLIEIVETRS